MRNACSELGGLAVDLLLKVPALFLLLAAATVLGTLYGAAHCTLTRLNAAMEDLQ